MDFHYEVPEIHTDSSFDTGININDNTGFGVHVSGFYDTVLSFHSGTISLKNNDNEVSIYFRSQGYQNCSYNPPGYNTCPPVKSFKLVYWATP